MSLSVPFITKLLPPRKPGSFLSRPRLLDLLYEASVNRATLLVAGAGFGKTSLLLDFAEDAEVSVSWLSLDRSDNDPKTFLSYLVAAVSRVFSDYGRRSNELLKGASSIQELEQVLGVILTEMFEAIPQKFVLVLDDFHQLELGGSIAGFLDRMVQGLPPNCHLVIASRTRPSLPSFVRLVAEEQITVIVTDDLRFTLEETRSLLKLRLPNSEVEDGAQEIHRLCDGWVLGLMFASSQLKKGRKPTLDEQSPMFDYYATQIFEELTPAEQNCLLSVSVLDDLDPGVCSLVTHDPSADAILHRLSEQETFSGLFERGVQLRITHLFRDFLRARLLKEPERADRVFSAAGRAWEQLWQWDRAITVHMDGGRWEDAVRLLEQVGLDLVDDGKFEQVAAYLDRLPPQFQRSAAVATVRAAVGVNRNDPDQALRSLSPIFDNTAAEMTPLGVANALRTRAAAWRMKGDIEQAVADGEAALSAARTLPDEALRGKIHHHLGVTYALAGDYPSAIEHFRAALAIEERRGNSHQVALLDWRLGTALEEVGRLSEAVFCYERSAAHWRGTEDSFFLASVLNNLALVYQLRGEYPAAQRLLKEALDASISSLNTRAEAIVLLSLADLYAELLHLPGAENLYLRGLEISRRLQRASLQSYALDGLAQISLLRNYPRESLRYLDDASAALKAASGDRNALALHRIAEARYQLETNSPSTALAALEEASTLLDQSGARPKLARVELLLAEGKLAVGSRVEAEAHVLRACALAESVGTLAFLRPVVVICPNLRRNLLNLRSLPVDVRTALAESPLDVDVQPIQIAASPPGRKAGVPTLKCFGFGSGELHVDGGRIPDHAWGWQKAKELFFYLLVQGQPGVSRERATSSVWPDASPAKGKSSFHSALYLLRHRLDERVVPEREGAYSLNPEWQYSFDVEEFERLITEGLSLAAGQPARFQLFRRAIELHRRPFLEDFYSEWCEELRRHLIGKYLSVLLSVADYALEQGDFNTAVQLCERYLEGDPYDEVAYLLLMKISVAQGDRLGALSWHRRYMQQVVDILQCEPSEPIQGLYQALLAS